MSGAFLVLWRGASENERAPGNSQSGKRCAAHGHDRDFYWDIFAGAVLDTWLVKKKNLNGK
jgi:hypothetical protein